MAKRAFDGASESAEPNKKRVLYNIAPASHEHPRTDISAVLENERRLRQLASKQISGSGRERRGRRRATAPERTAVKACRIQASAETLNAILARYCSFREIADIF